MKTMTALVLGLAAASVCGMFAGCEGDPSAPTRPRTQLVPFTPDEKAKDNAEKRELEKPGRENPVGGTKEFPGQSRATPEENGSVITADARKAAPGGDVHRHIPTNGSDSYFPQSRFVMDYYPGPLPHLPEVNGITPMVGATQVPGTNQMVEHSWGQVLVLQDYPHRQWPETQATYMAANVKHNPIYYQNIQQRLSVTQNDDSFRGNWKSNLYEVPWFYLESIALPGLWCFDCPFGQVATQRLGVNVNYFSYVPAGPIVSSPTPGIIKWDYPFLAYRGTDVSSMPTVPIAPTPGLSPVPHGEPTTEPATAP